MTHHKTPLDFANLPGAIAAEVHRQPEYFASLPTRTHETATPDELVALRHRAFGQGALAAARRAEHNPTKTNLEKKLVTLTATFSSFEEGLRQARSMQTRIARDPQSYEARENFREGKARIRRFNDALQDVIDNGANHLSFDDLLNFMTTMYRKSHGSSPEAFKNEARSTLIGMRNELAVEQALLASGIEYEQGTDEDDSKGGDIIVNGVRIDIKSSYERAEEAKQQARDNGYNPDVIIWSRIRFPDFEGRLTLPFEKAQELGLQLRADIEKAVKSEKQQRVA